MNERAVVFLLMGSLLVPAYGITKQQVWRVQAMKGAPEVTGSFLNMGKQAVSLRSYDAKRQVQFVYTQSGILSRQQEDWARRYKDAVFIFNMQGDKVWGTKGRVTIKDRDGRDVVISPTHKNNLGILVDNGVLAGCLGDCSDDLLARIAGPDFSSQAGSIATNLPMAASRLGRMRGSQRELLSSLQENLGLLSDPKASGMLDQMFHPSPSCGGSKQGGPQLLLGNQPAGLDVEGGAMTATGSVENNYCGGGARSSSAGGRCGGGVGSGGSSCGSLGFSGCGGQGTPGAIGSMLKPNPRAVLDKAMAAQGQHMEGEQAAGAETQPAGEEPAAAAEQPVSRVEGQKGDTKVAATKDEAASRNDPDSDHWNVDWRGGRDSQGNRIGGTAKKETDKNQPPTSVDLPGVGRVDLRPRGGTRMPLEDGGGSYDCLGTGTLFINQMIAGAGHGCSRNNLQVRGPSLVSGRPIRPHRSGGGGDPVDMSGGSSGGATFSFATLADGTVATCAAPAAAAGLEKKCASEGDNTLSEETCQSFNGRLFLQNVLAKMGYAVDPDSPVLFKGTSLVPVH